ncbi:hypothetical protein ANAPC5_00092 [Anaplasma phagocytophilum]|nr:hypothetical protein ANAPC2_00920 [Anaplasma phagocytophilum]SBO32533.1 hypothetical protein ANAPC3_00896 [Anaplasma phagocytophilum]SBO32785.1 hypothetical protein ANAPC4_00929 [Anaplasma phagocytophilum]SCV61862.1 hypothetical protein ANAPC5_00092 [Anaplasma phagocytophilum]SCV62482.1 hypothetical protein ANAPH2_00320 [Anaplasma phagocytophilum]
MILGTPADFYDVFVVYSIINFISVSVCTWCIHAKGKLLDWI